MESLLSIVLGNAVVATLLALVAVGAGRLVRRPALTHGLWLLVLLKLLTPPLVCISIPLPATAAETRATSVENETLVATAPGIEPETAALPLVAQSAGEEETTLPSPAGE